MDINKIILIENWFVPEDNRLMFAELKCTSIMNGAFKMDKTRIQ